MRAVNVGVDDETGHYTLGADREQEYGIDFGILCRLPWVLKTTACTCMCARACVCLSVCVCVCVVCDTHAANACPRMMMLCMGAWHYQPVKQPLMYNLLLHACCRALEHAVLNGFPFFGRVTPADLAVYVRGTPALQHYNTAGCWLLGEPLSLCPRCTPALLAAG